MTTKLTLFLVFLGASLAAYAEKQDFSRYESIVTRQMFGELPPGFDPTKMPSEVARGGGKQQEKELTKEQEKLQSSIHFSAINVLPDGSTAVGFTDNSNSKAPVNYYLKVGESRDGWKVEEADAKTATMTVVKGDVQVTLELGGNSGKGGGQTQPRGDAQAGAVPAAAGAAGGGVLNTLRGRRAEHRRRAEALQAAELQKLREEQAAKEQVRAEQAAQREAEREAEREEQRKQLQAIQEELRKAREESARQKESDANNAAE